MSVNEVNLTYVISVHNEESLVKPAVQRTIKKLEPFSAAEIILVENASRDNSKEQVREATDPLGHIPIRSHCVEEAGLGVAWRKGIEECVKPRNASDTGQHWILLTTADLPFGFSDLEHFLELCASMNDFDLVAGSKSHKRSQMQGWSVGRKLGSYFFRLLRRGLLGMKTSDPQGTLFIRAGIAKDLVKEIESKDYFFSTELVFLAEQKQLKIKEIPVHYKGEARDSHIRIFRDGFRMLRQMFLLAWRPNKLLFYTREEIRL